MRAPMHTALWGLGVGGSFPVGVIAAGAPTPLRAEEIRSREGVREAGDGVQGNPAAPSDQKTARRPAQTA